MTTTPLISTPEGPRMPRWRPWRTAAAAVCVLPWLAACGSTPPSAEPALDQAPAAWHSPWTPPSPAVERSQWWAAFDDRLLQQVLDAAEQASPDLASARTRLERSRADRVAAGAVLTPVVNAVAAGQRERVDKRTPVVNTRTGGFQASWELDLFGAARAGRDARQALLEGTEAGLQGLRTAVAAETALAYIGLRSCEAQRQESEADARSREATARVSEAAQKAGFLSAGEAATAVAGAAQARALVVAQQVQCDKLVKALVALTAWEEPRLRTALAPGRARVPQAPALAVAALPADLLAQRPDLRQAERDVVAAAAQTREAQARRWPTVGLAGTVGSLRVSSDAGRLEGQTWTLGPLQVSFPVFDGGVRRANVATARAAYDEAVLVYQAKVRQAVREVEEAMLDLNGLQAREADVRQAREGFESALTAADTRFRTGLSSVFELEDARRNAAGSRIAWVELQRDRAVSSIALYRALGGGWLGVTEPESPAPALAEAPPLAH